jgi:hypothetical protein
MQIEVRNIDVIWNKDGRVLQVNKSNDTLEIIDDNYVEATTYPKIYFYIGFRVLTNNILHTPYFHLGENKQELLKIEDPISGEIWWIQNGDWDPSRNKILHDSYRTAGTMSLHIQGQELKVKINTNNFEVHELEYYLNDFKYQLWELFLNANSMVGANVEKTMPNIFSEEMLAFMDKFIEAGEKILQSPKFFLKEKQGLAPINKAKPVARTFRELVTKQDPRMVTSRLHHASYDNAENRYVNYCIDRLFFLVNKAIAVTGNMSQRFNTNNQGYLKEAEELSESKYKKINKTVFFNELKDFKKRATSLENQLKQIEDDIENYFNSDDSSEEFYFKQSFAESLEELRRSHSDIFISPNPSNKPITHSMSIGRVTNNNDTAFFCNYLNNKYIKQNNEDLFLMVEYPEPIFNLLLPFSPELNSSKEKYTATVTGFFVEHSYYVGDKIVWTQIQDIQIEKTESLQQETNEYLIVLGNNYANSNRAFFCQTINNLDPKEYIRQHEHQEVDYLVIDLRHNIFETLEQITQRYLAFRIKTRPIKRFETASSGARYMRLILNEISSIEILNSTLHKSINSVSEKIKEYEVNAIKYENNGWIDNYTSRERSDIQQEIKNIRARANYFNKISKQYSNFNQQFSNRYKKLRNLKLAFQELNIARSNYFPNSMVFVQNPDYSSLHSNYKAIQKHSNITMSQLEALVAFDTIGLISISALYERWVLLQIIKVLTQEFHLILEDGWQQKLIDSVIRNQYDIELKTSMPAHQFSIVLSYEKRLNSGKRPDFILDVFYHTYEYDTANNSWTYSSENDKRSRLVMDAKFYDQANEEKLSSTVNELYTEKDYSEGETNRVFIIHPSIRSINDITSPLIWGQSADYGHVDPNGHQKGHIRVIPSLSEYQDSMDDLKRLILMHLQSVCYPLPHRKTDTKKIDDKSEADWHNFFCSSCGANRDYLKVTCQKTKQTRENTWIIECSLCNQMTKETYCFVCDTRLFKNGFKWTYHGTYAVQISNCKCPNCGSDLSKYQ